MFNVFAGGAVSRMAIFALGIMPYISSSIIVQLLTGVSDYFKNLKSQGETGRLKITQITRYGTVLLASSRIRLGSWIRVISRSCYKSRSFF